MLSLTALGVVYGDIGTSPLYAMKQCFRVIPGGPTGSSVAPTPDNVFGVLSLIVWALTMVVTVKYIFFIMRADNDGEGGILALLALIQQRLHRDHDSTRLMVLGALGLFGAALLYGDGVITPAVSVLGAVEGIDVATPALRHLVVPISVVVLFILFLFQRGGTTKIGRVFGPVMMLWFASIALFGGLEIAKEPSILKAVNPWYGVLFFMNHGWHGIFILGSVVLAVTGAEALYADMGHFGRLPIRLAWAVLVFPSLLLNYFGQGALLLRDPSASLNPFYLLIPKGLIYPMLFLATAAAVIASQALISGAFSLTHQAMQLGYSPRLTVTHTSKHEAGQIFIPQVNRRAHGRQHRARPLLRLVERARVRVRHRGHGHDGDHDDSVHADRAASLGLVALQGDRVPGGLPHDRWRVPRRERDQDRIRRLVPARRGTRGLSHDDHVESTGVARCTRCCAKGVCRSGSFSTT